MRKSNALLSAFLFVSATPAKRRASAALLVVFMSWILVPALCGLPRLGVWRRRMLPCLRSPGGPAATLHVRDHGIGSGSHQHEHAGDCGKSVVAGGKRHGNVG